MSVKRRQRTVLPCALTIAGSDSGGGAGVQADLKTFASLDVHGTSALTCVTAQNPGGVRCVHPIPSGTVRAQVEMVFAELPPKAIKTGMLFSAPVIRAVAGTLGQMGRVPLVIDPVMVATSGAVLLQPAAIRALRRDLLPLATVITPNLDEASLLLGRELGDLDDLRQAARDLFAEYGCAVLLKGGHLKTSRRAFDLFYDGKAEGGGGELVLEAARVKGVSTHGTGCTMSAALTAGLAHGLELRTAVELAKNFVTRAIAESVRVARHDVLCWLPR